MTMRQRIMWASLFALLLATAITLGVLAGGGPVEPIRIGAIFNTSGGMKWLDQPALNGLMLAAEEINAEGGVLGRDIEVVSVDGTTDVVKMTDLAAELADRDDIVAITGITEPLHSVAPVRATIKRADGGFLTFAHSETAIAVGRVTHDAGVPFVSVESTLPDLPARVGDDVFMVAAGQGAGAAAIAQFAWDELGARDAWVLVDEESAYAGTLATAFEESWDQRGGKVTHETYAPGAVIAIPDQIQRLQDMESQPEVVFIASLQNDGGYLLDQLREAGVVQPALFADVVDSRYIEAMGGKMENVFMATHGSLVDSDPDIQEFTTIYAGKYGTAPESASALLGYDTMQLIADAMRRAGSTERREVSKSLSQTSGFVGITGALSYPDPGWAPLKPITIVRYEEGSPAVVAELIPG